MNTAPGRAAAHAVRVELPACFRRVPAMRADDSDVALQTLLLNRHEPQGHFRICHRVWCSELDRDFIHRNLFLAFADQVLDVSHFFAELVERHILQPHAARGRIDDELCQHGVEGERRDT